MLSLNYLIFLLILGGFVVVESGHRQKKDVHHMIILKDKPKSGYSRPHRHHGSRERNKRPANKYSSEESISSYEDLSYERPPQRKQKNSKRHKHRVHNTIPNNIEWSPMSSQELFGTQQQQQQQVYPGAYQNGGYQYGQPVPIEITTPYGMPANTFFSYESTSAYPPLDSYRPFDYSVLEPQGSNNYVSSSAHHHLVTSTPFSIIVDNSTNGGSEKPIQEEMTTKKTRGRRGRGSSRFKVKN